MDRDYLKVSIFFWFGWVLFTVGFGLSQGWESRFTDSVNMGWLGIFLYNPNLKVQIPTIVMIAGWVLAGLPILLSGWVSARGGTPGNSPVTITTTYYSDGSRTVESSGGGTGDPIVLIFKAIFNSIIATIKTIIYLIRGWGDNKNLGVVNVLIFIAGILLVGILNWTGGDTIKLGGVLGARRNQAYEGELSFGKRHGMGKLTFPNGNVYEGEFVRGEITGKGKYTYADGNVFEGDFIKGVVTGKGKFTSNEGYIYEGDFVKGEFSGYGKMTYANGKTQEGYWRGGEYLGAEYKPTLQETATGVTAITIYKTSLDDKAHITGKKIRDIDEGEYVVLTGRKGNGFLEAIYENDTGWIVKQVLKKKKQPK